MNLHDTLLLAWPVFVQGLLLSLGLIVAIGAQNAFVLRPDRHDQAQAEQQALDKNGPSQQKGVMQVHGT